MKKWIALALVCIMVCAACIACTPPAPVAAETPAPTSEPAAAQTPAPEQVKGFTPGTYTGKAMGRNGDVEVEVSFDEKSILSVEIKKHEETKMLSDAAIERIPKAIVDNQSLGVDVVSYATITSGAIIAAVTDCVKQAGGDVDALRAVAVAPAESKGTVEMTADVIVVGGGSSGMAAAVAAAEAGSSVIVVEKTTALGGNSMLSRGAINAAYRETQKSVPMTPALLAEAERIANLEPHDEYMAKWQNALKDQLAEYKKSKMEYLFDSPELHMIHTYMEGDYFGNPELIEHMCTEILNTIPWLQEHGAVLNEKAAIGQGTLWPRANVVWKYVHGSETVEYKSGQAFIDVFAKSITERNLPVEFVYEVRCDELLMKDGAAVGVAGNNPNGDRVVFHANNGVVLATGGFGANVEMRQKYNTQWPDLGASVPTTNSGAIQGDGMVMAEKAGAQLIDMGLIQLLPVADPTTGESNTRIGDATNVYVNKEGKRFVREDERRDVLSKAILSQTDKYMFLISDKNNSELDEKGINAYGLKEESLLEQGKAVKADTLEELAQKIGVDPKIFIETINKYNAAVDAGKDEEFGRLVFNETARIDEAPFYACKRSPAVHHTMGGVRVDKATHALTADGQVIPGLYAVGEVAGGYHGGNRIGGNAISDCLNSGRIGGANAAAKK